MSMDMNHLAARSRPGLVPCRTLRERRRSDAPWCPDPRSGESSGTWYGERAQGVGEERTHLFVADETPLLANAEKGYEKEQMDTINELANSTLELTIRVAWDRGGTSEEG